MSCATVDPNAPSVCDTATPESNSFICETVSAKGLRAESIASILVDVNISGLATGLYTLDKVTYVTKMLRTAMEKPISYRSLIHMMLMYNEEIKEEVEKQLGEEAGPYVGLGLFLVSRHLHNFKSDELISEFDRGLISQLMDYVDEQSVWAEGLHRKKKSAPMF